MDKKAALEALAALSQETRLDVFRLLVRSGRDGMLAGEVAEALNVRQNTLSANLSILVSAGLIRNQREGRAIRYFASMDGMQDLLGYLVEDCCGGKPELCQPLIRQVGCGC
ncbi:metalloregulator ArsR/SmtB family transcription factor [Microvirga tunisiensis]|uniref:Metalloregulator ArsR/SmtB family transcription factor n=2 Tax=Pannonibacter tanglangensis TaxID=2750084 RepID=A0A7X5F3Y1_9HYPH|nr:MULTISPECIES: metalloregulator ArsR/SmtB family transcription factor [unclassified Pannonibacter]NBN64839.1 metalloregulator ArsR/SmtB family transcription factor [Pannonibacter sp. XCT-34]NBN79342.1 metalloregulator ArsR/SmtB family transcription factor [Pannonibacter sp. XCT-53]